MIRVLLSFWILVLFTVSAQAADPFVQLEKGGKGGWLNTTRPLTADDFKGKAVLLDFWTYGCVNCMQIIPDLSYLEEKFGNKLLIIGVHSAKFEGEQANERILAAAQRFGLRHPVINDSDYAIWDIYKVQAWPTQVLLDPQGEEVSRYSGEGHRGQLERDIAALDIGGTIAPAPVAAMEDKSVLFFPARIILSGQTFIIADAGHNQVVLTDITGKILYRIGSGKKGLRNGDFQAAQFNQPHGFAAVGNKIYVADTGNHALRLIDLAAKKVTTLAGTGERGSGDFRDKSVADNIALASPWSVIALNERELVIAMAGTHQLWVYNLDAQTLEHLAGKGEEEIKDGPALQASLAQPSALSLAGNTLYFIDAESSALRELKDGKVKTLIGTGLFDFGLKDGKYPEARLQHPQGLFADADKIYVADTYNNAIRIYDLKSGELSTLALKGPKLAEPGDIFVSGSAAYVADTDHNAIKTIDLKTGQVSGFDIH